MNELEFEARAIKLTKKLTSAENKARDIISQKNGDLKSALQDCRLIAIAMGHDIDQTCAMVQRLANKGLSTAAKRELRLAVAGVYLRKG